MSQTANRGQQQDRGQSRELAPVGALAPLRLPVTNDLMKRLSVSEGEWRVLCDSTFPAARSVEAIALALSYCRHRNLDIFKRPVHIVPMYSTALKRMVETVWPSIAEIRTTATRTGAYAGIDDVEFGPLVERDFILRSEDEQRNTVERPIRVAYPEWARVVVHRLVGGVRCPFVARVFWSELYATAARGADLPNEMWRKRPFGQIDKCVEAAALRKAFPEELGNEYAAEEMEGRILDDQHVQVADIPNPAASAPRPPPRPAPKTEAKPQEEQRREPPREQRQEERQQPAEQRRQPPAEQRREEQAQQQPDNIVDAEVEEIDEEQMDETVFLQRLRDDMAVAMDEASIEEVWNEYRPEERFADDPLWLEICQKNKALQLRRVGASQ